MKIYLFSRRISYSDQQQVSAIFATVGLDSSARFSAVAVFYLYLWPRSTIGEIVKRLDSLSVVFPIGRSRSPEENRFDDQPWIYVSQPPALRAPRSSSLLPSPFPLHLLTPRRPVLTSLSALKLASVPPPGTPTTSFNIIFTVLVVILYVCLKCRDREISRFGRDRV